MFDRDLAAKRIRFSLAGAAAALVATWLFSGEMSPLHSLLLRHPAIPNAWGRVNLPSHFLGVTLSGNLHQPNPFGYCVGIFLQWGTTAFLASLLIIRRHPA